MNARRRAVLAALLSLGLAIELPSPPSATAGSTLAAAAAVQPAAAHPITRVVVHEPARRTPAPARARATIRAVTAIPRAASGVHVAGPPMLARPYRLPITHGPGSDLGAPTTAGPAKIVLRPAGSAPKAPGRTAPVPSLATPQRYGTSAVVASGAGINHWWRYQEQNVPGGGHVMVNVGTGNLLLQADDMNVPHMGIALAFRRTYNAQSLHDASGDDGTYPYGTFPSLYGTGWTNTYDAHLARTADGTVWSVFDIDGARYDYSHVPNSYTWTAPPGQHATLTYDDSCGMLWTKKSGTTYYFYRPNASASCPSLAQVGGYAGRLYQIAGRNQNTALTFSYSWLNGDASASGKITQIDVTAESGLRASLRFGPSNGFWLLSSLTRPDGVAISYGYDAAGNMTSVTLPPNNGTPPGFSDGVAPVQTYGYQSAGTRSYLAWAASPRWSSAPGGCSGDLKTGCGAYLLFSYAYGNSPTTTSLTEIDRYGFMDPTPTDGFGTPIQPMPSGGSAVATAPALSEYYALGQLGTAATPTLRDSDGHATNWVTDALGRPTQTQECASTQNQQCVGTLLISGERWDADNNLVAEIEPRGFAQGVDPATYETDYAYDANGNTVAEAGPPLIAQTRYGPQRIRPTQLYSYDPQGHNNVTAYCDQTWSQTNGRGWESTGNPGPSDSLCPTTVGTAAQPGATVIGYASRVAEPFGEVTSITTPLGYQHTISYPTQATDYGLPIAVTGTAFTQVDGKTTLQLKETFGYDASGNLTTYGTGNGTWNLSYDALDRLTVATDPDGHASYTSYLPSGAVSKSETPAQHAANAAGTYGFDAGVLHTYDPDGNELTQVHHHGNVAGTTQNWYDGADRLVEVALPGDSASSPVNTRYLYDLSAGGAVPVGGLTIRAYGNLYDTKEYTTTSGSTTAAFVDARGQAFDGLDRLVAKITFPPNADTTAVQATSAYDTNAATLGLLASTTDAIGETATMSYDTLGRKSGVTFSGDNGKTPARTYAYDPNGRPAAITSSVFGTQSSTYDAEGRLTSVSEPNGGGITSPAVIGYDYYPDGHRKDVTVQSSALTAAPLMTYMYRADGQRTSLSFAYGGATYPFAWTYSSDGRRLTQADPFTSAPVPHTASYTPPASTYTAKQWAYDANGVVASLSLPVVGNYTQMTHDLEGALSGYSVRPSQPTVPAPPGTLYQFAIGTNVVGESSGESFKDISTGRATELTRFSYNNGHAIPYPGNLSGYPNSGYQKYELINGVRTALETWSRNSSSNLQCPNPNLTTETYDNAGRHTTTDNTTYDTDCIGSPLTDTTAYDAENHPVRAVQTGAVASDGGGTSTWGLTWGPNGHPVALQQSPNSTTLTNPTSTFLHYDGDTILFTTSDAGQLVDIRAELLGLYAGGTSPGFIVQDRDVAELNVTSHSAIGYSGLNYGSGPFHNGKVTSTASVFEPASDGSQPDPDSGLPEGMLQYTHPDGFFTPLGRIQGARSMDPDLGTWKSPDAYAGDIRDPMSQKPYMWNRNNPFQYSDPSGYEAGNRERLAAMESMLLQEEMVFMERALAAREMRQTIAETRAAAPSRVRSGKAPEITSGVISETAFLRNASSYLGKDFREASPGRFLSNDGMRQVRFGEHETKDPTKVHAHFESYDKPASQGGKVTETSTVIIHPDVH